MVPLWPQLEEILRAYVFGPRLLRGGRLLFPSFATGEEALLTDVRKLLDRVAKRAGRKEGELYTRAYRHTYCAARLQTLDRGAPVVLDVLLIFGAVAGGLGLESLGLPVEQVFLFEQRYAPFDSWRPNH